MGTSPNPPPDSGDDTSVDPPAGPASPDNPIFPPFVGLAWNRPDFEAERERRRQEKEKRRKEAGKSNTGTGRPKWWRRDK